MKWIKGKVFLVAVAASLTGYVGIYYVAAERGVGFTSAGVTSYFAGYFGRGYTFEDQGWGLFFKPMHYLDRRLRPNFWVEEVNYHWMDELSGEQQASQQSSSQNDQ